MLSCAYQQCVDEPMAEVRKDMHFRFFFSVPTTTTRDEATWATRMRLGVHFRHYNQRPKQRILHFFFFCGKFKSSGRNECVFGSHQTSSGSFVYQETPLTDFISIKSQSHTDRALGAGWGPLLVRAPQKSLYYYACYVQTRQASPGVDRLTTCSCTTANASQSDT